MGNDLKINKSILLIVLFLLLFGTAIFVFRSGFFLQLGTENPLSATSHYQHSSALSEEQAQNFDQDEYLVIYDPETAGSKKLKNNIAKTLDYMKKEYEMVPVSQLQEDLSEYQNVIIAFSELTKTGNFTSITNYLTEGGKLFFAVRPEVDDTYLSNFRTLGIEKADPLFHNTIGIDMNSDLLLKGENLKIEESFVSNSSLSVQLDKNSTVLARTMNGYPLMWSFSHGEGTVMMFNGTMLDSKMNRGFIVGALSFLNDDFIYPVMNSKVMYIDDFPAPFPEGHNKKLEEDYNVDIPTFFQEIWWPDMVKTAKKYDLKYTGMMIETYTDEVKGPFENRLAKENLKIYGRELIRMGGEVGLHGYNHQSLTKNQEEVQDLGYTAWESEEDMKAALTEANQFFNDLFPDYTLRTYVPPSNVLSEEGKKAVQEAVPSIQNIGSLYHADSDGNTYIQEFEATNTINEIPRFSSDYHYRTETKWIIANSATFMGAFSHFIHPDDILDKVRSESEGWDGLLDDFNNMMKDVKEDYPWMKSQTASESAESLKKYQNAEVFIAQNDEKIKVFINNFAGELDFILRSDKHISESSGYEAEKISKDRYFIRAKSDEFVIELGGE